MKEPGLPCDRALSLAGGARGMPFPVGLSEPLSAPPWTAIDRSLVLPLPSPGGGRYVPVHSPKGEWVIKHQIQGTANQMVVCQVDSEQTVSCEAGKFLWKTANVGIETRFSTPETEEANKEKSGFQKFV